MIHLWLVDFQEILEGVPRRTLAYTFSFELPRHEMYTMGDLRQLKFGRNWLHIIFRQIVFEAAQILQELAPRYFSADCFGGRSDGK
jgi:hypothetical protein